MAVIPRNYDLSKMSSDTFAEKIADDKPVAVLLPVGAIEPHGPHLPLITDITISEASAAQAAALLEEHKVIAVVAPAVPYGITLCASAFKGAFSVSREALVNYLASVVEGFLANGVDHVCLVNNHLEPEHDRAIRSVAKRFPHDRVTVATPLSCRWARTLSEEFKRGACHAGQYETSIILAADSDLVDRDICCKLPDVPISLATKLKEGISDFKEMGLERAYSGAPAEASIAHGKEQITKLATMIATEIVEALL